MPVLRAVRAGTDGLSDSEIAAVARSAGVAQQVIGDFGDRTFEPWVTRSTAAVLDAGLDAVAVTIWLLVLTLLVLTRYGSALFG